MKKIFFAFLFGLLTTNSYAEFNIHVVGEWASRVLSKFIPDKKVRGEVVDVYNEELEKNGGTLSAESVAKISDAAGWDRNQDKETRSKFRQELIGSVQYYEVCGKDKGKTGAVCVNDFSTLTVTMDQATGLAKLYALRESNDQIQCGTKARMDTQTVYSNNIRAMGMAQTTSTPYIQCTSYNGNKFYEFKFNNVDGNIDSTNLKNFKTGICKTFGAKYVTKELRDYKFDVCESIDDEATCDKVDNILIDANIGYVASWGALGSAKLITGNAYDYCMLYEQVAKDKDGVLLYEKTAFGLDGRVFLNAGIQRKGSAEIKDQIRTYVENTMGKENVKSFDCEDNHHTVKLKGRSGTDDMIRCTINGKTVEFFFDDLSEWEATYDQSGREAMNCIAWGGTFTGKKCIGLDQKMCDKVRDANAQSCPECKKIQWNDKAKVCELPASVSATNLKRGLTYSAIVGGAVASVVITIGTAGTGGVTVGTAIIMMVETAGAGIELGAQINIDNKADKFFVESANCKSESCAKELVNKYLSELARIGRDLTDAEADATDKEMARLIGLIPANSDWWIEYLKDSDGSSFLAKANDGGWTAAQVWRAIGIGMQFAGVASSITGWVIKKTGYLERTLDRTSKILLNSAKTAEKNIVKVDKLDDVGKEWYALWKQHAPKNQTFTDFQKMYGNDLSKAKKDLLKYDDSFYEEVVKEANDRYTQRNTEFISKYKDYISEHGVEKYIDYDEIRRKNAKATRLTPETPGLEKWTQEEIDEAEKIYKARVAKDEAKEAIAPTEQMANNKVSYSTYDSEFSRTMASKRKIDELRKERAALAQDSWIGADDTPEIVEQKVKNSQRIKEIDEEIEELKKSVPTQWDIAEKFQLKNIGNVVSERANQFDEIIKANPEIQSKLDEKVWARLSDQERSNVAQKILDEYAAKTGTPRAEFGLDYNTTHGGYYSPGTNKIILNPTEQFQTADGMLEVLAHEHGHFIDYIMPNKGALGEQYGYYAEKIYSNVRDDGYRVALTEQSSYKIGPGVSHGKEYELESAKRKIVASGEDLDREVAAYGAAAPAAVGVGVGTVIQVMDAIDKKKDKK